MDISLPLSDNEIISIGETVSVLQLEIQLSSIPLLILPGKQHSRVVPFGSVGPLGGSVAEDLGKSSSHL